MHESPYSDQEAKDAAIVEEALGELHQGNLEKAEAMLLQVVQTEPVGYVHEYEFEGKRYIKFWSMPDFLYFVSRLTEDEKQQDIIWVANAYPRALFNLGFIQVEKGDMNMALAFLVAGLKLEPQQPEFLLELGRLFGAMGDAAKALNSYETILARGEIVHPRHRAAALRGIGFQYIEQGKLDRAVQCYQESLILEPENEIATHELAYIAHLKSGGGKVGGSLTKSGDPVPEAVFPPKPPKKKWWPFGRN